MLYVYMEDMIVKSNEEEWHLDSMFHWVQQHNMRINIEKCTFRIITEKFLGFYLTERDIETNSDKCEVVIKMETQSTKKKVIKLNMMLATLNRSFSKSA